MRTCANEFLSPASLIPRHETCDALKLDAITLAMRQTGWQGRPLLVLRVCGNEHVYNHALTGSERIAAARLASLPLVPCIVVDFGVWIQLRRIIEDEYNHEQPTKSILTTA